MTFLEAFAGIFVGLWTFFSSPAMCALYGIVIIIVGVFMFIVACYKSHQNRAEFWERLSFFVGGPIVVVVGLAIVAWAATSSPNGFTWA